MERTSSRKGVSHNNGTWPLGSAVGVDADSQTRGLEVHSRFPVGEHTVPPACFRGGEEQWWHGPRPTDVS